jgi:hypothetical protein
VCASHQSADAAEPAHRDECNYANFDDGFARSWKILPDEPRLNILGHILPLGENVEGPQLDVELCTLGPDSHTLIDKRFYRYPQSELLCCLAVGPDIAPLAHELYYTRNTFVVRRGMSIGSGLLFLNVKSRRIIRQLASGEFGSDNIKMIHVVIFPRLSGPGSVSAFLGATSSEGGFTFACKDSITCDQKQISKIGISQDEFERLASNLVEFTDR